MLLKVGIAAQWGSEVWILNGQKEVGLQMVWISNGIWNLEAQPFENRTNGTHSVVGIQIPTEIKSRWKTLGILIPDIRITGSFGQAQKGWMYFQKLQFFSEVIATQLLDFIHVVIESRRQSNVTDADDDQFCQRQFSDYFAEFLSQKEVDACDHVLGQISTDIK